MGVSASGYSLWGGSAGARMAAVLGNADYLLQLTGREDIPQASAVIMQYTGYSTVRSLSALGIPTEFHAYDRLPHGFGLGTGTVAEGWLTDAVRFLEKTDDR